MQDLLEEEVAEQLGRRKSERRAAVDAPHGYRNGHGQPRRLSMMAGTIELRRPRVRGLEQRFESRILPLFVRRTEQVSELLPQLYLHGLAQGDFELALRGLLGDGAPLCPPRSSGCAVNGSWSTKPGGAGAWIIWRWYTPGPTGCT
jgi:transposase-like protein